MNINQKHRQLEEEKLAMEELVNYERALNEVIDSIPNEFKPRIVGEYERFLLLLKTALPYIAVKKQAKILDVGCGAGILSLVFKKMGHNVSSIDCWKKFPPTHVSYAETRLNKERLERQGVHTEDLDIAEEPLPFENDEFDLVLFLDAIEHLHSSPRKILADIRRALRGGGILILTTPNLATLKNRLFVLAGRSNYTELSYYYHSDFFTGHTREYTLNEVKQMLAWEGFDIRNVKFCSDSHILKKEKFKILNKLRMCNTLAMGFYLCATAIFPNLRYQMIIVGQKVER